MIVFLSLGIFLLLGDVVRGENPERVIGGIDVHNIEKYPFMVSMRLNGAHICGGSIISEYHILTAAHCITGVEGSSLRSVKIGTGDHRFEKSYKLYGVSKMKYHRGYNSGVDVIPDNDIGIIKLSKPIQFNNRTRPIKLSSSTPPHNVEALLLGWGLINSQDYKFPEVLQKNRIFIMNPASCNNLIGFDESDLYFCGYKGVGHASCDGDSGGPLLYNRELVGIVSSGFDPCEDGLPGLYANVYHYLDFIKDAMATM